VFKVGTSYDMSGELSNGALIDYLDSSLKRFAIEVRVGDTAT
jgi:hypothetical protein